MGETGHSCTGKTGTQQAKTQKLKPPGLGWEAQKVDKNVARVIREQAGLGLGLAQAGKEPRKLSKMHREASFPPSRTVLHQRPWAPRSP